MKIAVVGSRNCIPSDSKLEKQLADAEEIISGGARGVDAAAARYARAHNLKLTEFLPEYALFGRAAPIVRNKRIVDYADRIIAIWDGKSRGTLSVIRYAEKKQKECVVILHTE